MRTLLGLVIVCAASAAMAQDLPPGLHLVEEFHPYANTDVVQIFRAYDRGRPLTWEQLPDVNQDTICEMDFAFDTGEINLTCRVDIERDFLYKFIYCERFSADIVGPCYGPFVEPGHRKFFAPPPARPKASRFDRGDRK